MSLFGRSPNLTGWAVPLIYAAIALTAGLTIPRIEARVWPDLVSPMSMSSALAIYSAIASGMISLTGIVFSLTFVMVQFSATTYSPRLVLWLARDPVMPHALGMFTATFLYAVAALTGVDRSGSGKVPFMSVILVVVLLIASMGMFISIIQRVGLIQISRMLVFTGDQGRRVIASMSPVDDSALQANVEEFRDRALTQTLYYHGGLGVVQSVKINHLVGLARTADGVIEITAAVGDAVVDSRPLLRVFGASQTIDERALRKGIEIGGARTFEQDPKYAIRLLVDIAIKALSPAINDPTTAVQALDQIEDLLLRLGRCSLGTKEYRDSEGKPRLIMPLPFWDDLVLLAFDEIRFYGATSVQVMRRMNALISELISTLPAERHAVLRHWQERMRATITRSFDDAEERLEASIPDRQGLGMPREVAGEYLKEREHECKNTT